MVALLRHNLTVGRGSAPARSGRGGCSKVGDQITSPDAQRFGDSQQRVKADPLLATLNLSDVHGMQFGFLRELLLAQTSLGAVSPDCIAQNLEVGSGARHENSGKQAGWKLNTPNMGLFCSCIRDGLVSELYADGGRFLLIFERSGSLGPYEIGSRVGVEMSPFNSRQPARAEIGWTEFVRERPLSRKTRMKVRRRCARPTGSLPTAVTSCASH